MDMMMRAQNILRRHAAGFTLIELILTMVILSIIASMGAVFIGSPVLGYVDSVRRAELTDVADYSLRRFAREVRQALPNSLRVTTTGGVTYIEFIMTSGGGRYCSLLDGFACGTELSFADTTLKTFDVVGVTAASVPIVAGDYIVVYNQGQDAAHNSYAPADAYADCSAAEGCNIAQVAVGGVAGNTVTLQTNVFAAQTTKQPSPSSRFHVVPGGVRAVTYACPSARGVMRRYANYGFSVAQATPPTGGSSSIMVNNASCVVTYENNVGHQRNGMLTVALRVFDATGDESVTLLREIHLDNSP